MPTIVDFGGLAGLTARPPAAEYAWCGAGENRVPGETQRIWCSIKRESLWHGIRAGPSLNMKEPGGELDGWRIPSEVQTEERQKGELWEKEKGIFECFQSVYVRVCYVSEWQKSAHTHTVDRSSLWIIQNYETSQASRWKVSLQLLFSNSLKAPLPELPDSPRPPHQLPPQALRGF